MSHYSSMEEDHQQLLSFTNPHHHPHPRPHPQSWSRAPPSLDLQLSISVKPVGRSVEALKWEAAEQIRLASMEKAYAEHVMEMTRREMEVAQSEFSRARSLWDRAREEVERAEKMRERATNSSCMEITCFSCSQKFRP